MTVAMMSAAALALGIWVVLALFRGRFWRSGPFLSDAPAGNGGGGVVGIIPARNEAATIGEAVGSLLAQDWPGDFRLVVVDDGSSDGTAGLASRAAGGDPRLVVVSGARLPAGWTGKIWAMRQGVAEAARRFPEAEFLLLTDADIVHDPRNVSRLMAKAQSGRLDLVSLMVRLRCESFWERLLIPAFVFFFKKLYPFSWVADPDCRTAAAAGGCMLVRRRALEAAGGMEAIRDRVIDDVGLAAAIKAGGGRIWLGLSRETVSRRAYDSLGEIWRMVARTAFVQLRHSPVLLFGTVVGMILIYGIPPAAVVAGGLGGEPATALLGMFAWGLMGALYTPTLRIYRLRAILAWTLPVAALLYTMMTLDSALRHWRGVGNVWKGRQYGSAGPSDRA